jgi:hypothetical protein
MQLAEGRVTTDQIPAAVEMGQAGPAAKPAVEQKAPPRKKANRPAARSNQDDAVTVPVS